MTQAKDGTYLMNIAFSNGSLLDALIAITLVWPPEFTHESHIGFSRFTRCNDADLLPKA
jgi:hypothetical protein